MGTDDGERGQLQAYEAAASAAVQRWRSLVDLLADAARGPAALRQSAAQIDAARSALEEAVHELGWTALDLLVEEHTDAALSASAVGADEHDVGPASEQHVEGPAEATREPASVGTDEPDAALSPSPSQEPEEAAHSPRVKLATTPEVEPTDAATAPTATTPKATITPSVVEKLRRHMTPSLGVAVEPDLAEGLRALDGIRQRLGTTPLRLDGAEAVAREVGTLAAASQPDDLQVWASLSKRLNFTLTSWVAARARFAQERAEGDGVLPERSNDILNALFPRLAEHCRSTRPGVVHGLARGHEPRRNTWLADARYWQSVVDEALGRHLEAEPDEPPNLDGQLRELTEAVRGGAALDEIVARVTTLLGEGLSPSDTRLVRLLAPYEAKLPQPALSQVRRAIREATRDDSEDEGVPKLPEGWPLRPVVAGTRAAIVGGDSRPDQMALLQQIFELADVEWVPDDGSSTRRGQALVQRVKQGPLDLVIVLRPFVSHRLSSALFGARGESHCQVVLADGYGVQQVRSALERFLEAPEEGPNATL